MLNNPEGKTVHRRCDWSANQLDGDLSHKFTIVLVSDSPKERVRNAARPVKLEEKYFNPDPDLPYGLEIEHIGQAMKDFNQWLGIINVSLVSSDLERLEDIAMPANMSSIVGEFMHNRIPKYCTGIVQNDFHNGHPDMIPTGMYEEDSVQHGDHGIEVKASRYRGGWQGHNAENCWLMVFHYDSNSPNEPEPIRPFSLDGVFIAELEEDDWSFAGRGEGSRRTITASVLASGRDRMIENYVYDREQTSDQSQLSIDI